MATGQIAKPLAVTYSLNVWATRPFANGWTNLVKGNFADPQLATRGADDLLCYNRSGGVGAIFATVEQGTLDNGTPVQNGPIQIGGSLTFDQRWDKIVVGPFGKSGAQLLFYDAAAGQGEFFGLKPNGTLFLISRNTGWRSSWTQIIAGNFSGADGLELLFYDAAAGLGEFYSVDQNANVHLIRSVPGWRSSWYAILAGKFSNSKFDDLLFYDKSAGVGEFYHTDGSGGINRFNAYTDWRTTWRGVRAGGFAYGSNYNALLFYEDQTGYTEFYATDGNGGINLMNVNLGSVWPSRAARWQEVLAGNFIGSPLSSLVGYEPGLPVVVGPKDSAKPEAPITTPFQANVTYFQLIPQG